MNETKRKLLEAAVQEISARGFDKANVNHVAEAASLSVGTLYNYFPTKRDLMQAVLDEISQLHVESIVEKVLQSEDPIERMEAFFEAGFTFIESNTIQAKTVFNTLNSPDEEFKIRLFHAYQPLFELLGDEIILLGLSKGIFTTADPNRTASLIMFIYLGTGSQFTDEGKLWVSSEEVSTFVLDSLRYKAEAGKS